MARKKSTKTQNAVTVLSQGTELALVTRRFPTRLFVSSPELQNIFRWNDDMRCVSIKRALRQVLRCSDIPRQIDESFSGLVTEADRLCSCHAMNEVDVLQAERDKWEHVETLLLHRLEATLHEALETCGYWYELDPRGSWFFPCNVADVRHKQYTLLSALAFVADNLSVTPMLVQTKAKTTRRNRHEMYGVVLKAVAELCDPYNTLTQEQIALKYKLPKGELSRKRSKELIKMAGGIKNRERFSKDILDAFKYTQSRKKS